MSEPTNPPDELGSLAQSARKTSLSSARTTLFVLAVLQSIGGAIFFFAAGSIAQSEVDKQVQALGGQADEESVREALADTTQAMQVGAAFIFSIGAVFFVLGLLVYKIPVAATVTALVVFIGVHLLDAVVDPTALAKGIIIKAIVIVALSKAIQAAIAYERENREMAASPKPDVI